jgi:tetratricopeptide (TPR) repeat protein
MKYNRSLLPLLWGGQGWGKKLLPILFFLLSLKGFSQRDPYLDSLWKVWSDVRQADTNRLKAMYDFAWDGFLFSQPDSSYYFSKKMFDFAQKKGLKEFQARAKNLQFAYFFGKGDIDKAEEVNKEGMALWQAIGDKLGLAANATNFGILYQIQGNYSQAIRYFTLSLKYNEEVANKSGIGTSLHNIGHVYQDQLDYKRAIEYYLRSLEIREKEGETVKIAESEVNLGSVYLQLHEFDKARKSLERSLRLFTDLDMKPGISMSLGNMGMLYEALLDYDKAIEYYTRGLQIQQELGDKIDLSNSMANIGKVYLLRGQYDKALPLLKESLSMSQAIGDASGVKRAAGNLSEAYKKKGRYKEALEMHELFLTMWDSLNSEESKKELVRQEFKYNYEKKAAADSVHAVEEKRVVAAQLQQEQTTRYALCIGLVLLCIFGVFMVRRFRESQKQKAIIEMQKVMVEQKQREVMDSIHYASRIQKSLLPPEKYIDKQLKRLNKN